MESSRLNSLEAISQAVILGVTTSRTVGAQLAGILTTNMLYTAYSFYQNRKGSPLTVEEMEDVQKGVLNESMKFTQMYIDILCKDDDEQ